MTIKFDMIGLFVEDIQVMVGFYTNVIGLETDWNGEDPYAEFQHEGIRFSMYTCSELPELLGQTPEYPQRLNGTFELAINVGEPENVDRVYEQIVDGGGKPVYAPRDEPWQMRSSMISDPEGNLIEIASDFWV
jgi:lactoylglutathione lyase